MIGWAAIYPLDVIKSRMQLGMLDGMGMFKVMAYPHKHTRTVPSTCTPGSLELDPPPPHHHHRPLSNVPLKPTGLPGLVCDLCVIPSASGPCTLQGSGPSASWPCVVARWCAECKLNPAPCVSGAVLGRAPASWIAHQRSAAPHRRGRVPAPPRAVSTLTRDARTTCHLVFFFVFFLGAGGCPSHPHGGIFDAPRYASHAVQFHPHGGQFECVCLSARTPYGGASYAW